MGRHPRRLAEAFNYDPAKYAPRPTQPRILITLSDAAYDHHRTRAQTLGYVRLEAQRLKGMVRYFQALATPTQTWTDTRPPYLIALSERLLDPHYDRDRRSFAEGSTTSLYSPDLPRPHSSVVLADRPGPRHAIWWDPDLDTPRRKRTFVHSAFPLTYFANLALLWGIGDPYHRLFQTTPNALASNALEAIGREALTPSVLIPNPHPPKYGLQHRRKEIDW